MTYKDLFERLEDEPFKPFRIKTTLSNVYEILEPWMIFVGESSAVIALATRRDDEGHVVTTRFRTVAISHMVEIEDIEPTRRDQKRKRA